MTPKPNSSPPPVTIPPELNTRTRTVSRTLWNAELDRVLYATESALDVGSGIKPQTYVRTAVHICVEAHAPYVARMQAAHAHDSRFVFLVGTWQDVLRHFPDDSIDTAFALDVIEHLQPEDGFALIRELSRIARYQVVIFTPLGFYPQHYQEGEMDGWGMDGTKWQEHRSGWTPADILTLDNRWSAVVSPDFHTVDQHNRPLDAPWPAFWAILTKAAPPKAHTVHDMQQAIGRLGRLPAPIRTSLRAVWRLLRRAT